MASNTILARIKDESGNDEFKWLSQNRTLYADQFTENGPVSDEDRKTFHPKSMKDVFEHYQPKKSSVQMEDEMGAPVVENFEFHEIKDFDDEQLIEKSPHLSMEKGRITSYSNIIRQLERNKLLRNVLKDESATANLKTVLRILIKELEETK